jgi:hypothetical protein
MHRFVTFAREKTPPRNMRTAIALVAGSVMTAAFASSPAPEVPQTNWLVQRYADPMHKAGTVASTGQDSDTADNGLPKIAVVVRCWSATHEMDVRFLTNDDRQFTSDAVRWQFDKGALKTAHWRMSPRGNAIVVPEPLIHDLLRGMSNGKELVLYLLLNEDHRYRISLAGSAASIGEVEAGCGR